MNNVYLKTFTIVSLFSGKYPRTGRRQFAYHHRYEYNTLSSTVIDYICVHNRVANIIKLFAGLSLASD